MFRLRLRTTLALLLLVAASACGGDSSTNPEENGLRPGSYRLSVEVFAGLGTPDQALGRHRIVFRVNAPGTSPGDFEVTSSERIPPTGSTERDYLTMDQENTQVSSQEWTLRMESDDGSYQFRLKMKNVGYGDFQITSGCIVRLATGQTFQGSGCVMDRV